MDMDVRFGVDVGGTAMKIGMFKKGGELICKKETATDRSFDGKNILGDICRSMDEMLSDNGLTRKNCAGIGIGLPGPVTADGRILGCVNLGWGIFNIEETLSKMFSGVPVKAGNDANLAALGEQAFGGGKGFKNVVMMTIGTGVGGGIIIDGKIITGTNGAAGEIGHIPVNPNETERCSCGKCGCMEQYASATGIVRMAKKYIEAGGNSPYLETFAGGDFTAKDVLDGAKKGDPLCVEAAEQLGKYLGMALAAAASITNPDCMVIGGGVSKAGEFLLNIIQKHFMQQAFLPCRNVTFKLAELGNDAGIYGGAVYV